MRFEPRLSVVLVASLFAACGKDDPAPAPVATYGTCDLRSVGFTCIESTGTGFDIIHQHKGCTDRGGLWSADPCPPDNRIACCAYTLGMQFRECFYTGVSPDPDPQTYCADTVQGVWTPG